MTALMGFRRMLVVIFGGLMLVGIGVMALISHPESLGVLTICAGGIVTIITAYLGADGYVKGKQTENKPEVKP